MSFLYLDFEFNRTSESLVNLVAAVTYTATKGYTKYWLKNLKHKEALIKELTEFRGIKGTLVCYGGEAEARSLISLGLNPLYFSWIDLHIEYKMLLNHNRDLLGGTHLFDGTPIKIMPYERKPETGYAAACYRLLEIKVDTDNKTKMRDLIISDPHSFSSKEQDDILDYCQSDVENLPKLHREISRLLRLYIPNKYHANLPEEIRHRGENSVRVALMTTVGQPINTVWVNNIKQNASLIMRDTCLSINRQFPRFSPFRYNPKENKFVLNTSVVREWIKNSGVARRWKLTDGGKKGIRQFSLSLEAWEDHYKYDHGFPEGNFAAQMIKYLKLQQNLRSFSGNGDRNFTDAIGKDGFSRPYLNPYGAQSSRFQPPSTTFLFLKSAFFRAICQPPRGYVMAGIDFKSQEFLLSGIISGDEKMVNAYISGDVYLYFGKQIGMIPKDGTKETHRKERDLCKSTVLGLSYSMTEIGLSAKLTHEFGRVITENQAMAYIEGFNQMFPRFFMWKQDFLQRYKMEGFLRLPSGWSLFSGNYNDRSITNVPIQGTAADILRKSIALAQDRGLNVSFPLHDAVYLYCSIDKYQEDLVRLKECMSEAFQFYFTGKQKEWAKAVEFEGEAWGPDLSTQKLDLGFPVMVENLHIDPRGKKEYLEFERYFKNGIHSDLI